MSRVLKLYTIIIFCVLFFILSSCSAEEGCPCNNVIIPNCDFDNVGETIPPWSASQTLLTNYVGVKRSWWGNNPWADPNNQGWWNDASVTQTITIPENAEKLRWNVGTAWWGSTDGITPTPGGDSYNVRLSVIIDGIYLANHYDPPYNGGTIEWDITQYRGRTVTLTLVIEGDGNEWANAWSDWVDITVSEPPADNIIMPDEMPFTITPELVAEVGNRFYIGGNWTGTTTDSFAVSIEAPDVVLDGNHYTLTGTLDSDDDTYQCAIVTGGLSNITIFHINATCWNQGVAFDHIDSAWIDQNNMYGNYNASIGISWSNGINIAGNTLQDNGENGLYVGDSENILVMGENHDGIPIPTVISGNPAGIFFKNVTHGQIKGYCIPYYSPLEVESPGEVSSNGWVGLFIQQSEDIIVQNFTFSHQGAGIVVDQSSHIVINRSNVFDSNDVGIQIRRGSENCIIDNNRIKSEFSGIQINTFGAGCKDIYVSRNTIQANNWDEISPSSHGIFALEGENLTFQENTLTNSGQFGINIWQCVNVTIESNQFADHMSPDPNLGYGIVIGNTIRADIIHNILTNNRMGIWYHDSTFNYIWNNSINNGKGEGEVGIGLVEGSGITEDFNSPFGPPHSVTRNTVTGYKTGVSLENVVDIMIFDNYFYNPVNYQIGTGTSGIIWNISKTYGGPDMNIIGGEYWGGNFWGQPDGNGWSQITSDTDMDGICDNPYELGTGGYTDFFPLSKISVHFSVNQTDALQYNENPVVVQFTDESRGPIDEWHWYFDDGATSDEQNPSHSYSSIGAYRVELNIRDIESGSTAAYARFIYIRPGTQSGVPIWEGWNFVSTPRKLAEENNTLNEVFKDVDTGGRNVYYYNATLPNPYWEIVNRDDVIKPLDGIWIYSTRVGPFVPFTYDTNFTSSTPRIKHLYPGWNSIGIGSVYPMETMSYLASLDDKWEMLLEFDSSLQLYFPPQIQGIQTGYMDGGRGYWLYMNEEADLMELTG